MLSLGISRVRNLSLKKMWNLVSYIHEETRTAKCLIFFDMMWCFLKYGTGYLEYRVFGFAQIRGKVRKTFMTMKHNVQFVKKWNHPDFTDFFEDKIKFNQEFCEYIGRQWLDLRDTSNSDFLEFLQGKDFIFAKKISSCGGDGVNKICTKNYEDAQVLKDQLINKGQFLVEENLIQHGKMCELSSASINTLRIVTVLSGEKSHFVYCLIRVGDGIRELDNISSGGMYCPVNENGIIIAKAFSDKTGKYYEKHPVTGTKFEGFEIPYFNQAVSLVQEASLKIPQVKYVGWDVAICEQGPVLIEGNTIPGYDMCQNYEHLIEKKEGILPRFTQLLEQ